MKIEKLCEYFNEIGLVQLSNINTFLKIYSQISANRYKNPNDKIVLALFSYLTLVSKNNQNLYDLCKSIIESFSNNQVVNRYRGLNALKLIIKSKISSRFNSFLFRLNNYIYNGQNKNRRNNSKKNYSRPYNAYKEDNKLNTNLNYYNSIDKDNRHRSPSKKGKIIKKNNNNNEIPSYVNDIIEKISLENEKEFTFSPLTNRNNKSKPKIMSNNNKRKVKRNYNDDNIQNIPYRYNNNLDQNLYNKYIPYKNNYNYGINNVISNEIEKFYDLNNVNPNYNSQNNFYPKNKYQKNFRPNIPNREQYPLYASIDYNKNNYINNYNNRYPNYNNNDNIYYHYYYN